MTELPYPRTARWARNEDGVNDLDHGRITDNAAEVIIPDEEFWALEKSGVLEEINDHYDLILSSYESDIIYDDLGRLPELVAKVEGDCPTLLAAVRDGAEAGFCIELSF